MDNSLLESIVNKIDKNICRSFNDNQLYLYQTRDDYFSSIYFKLVKELKSIYKNKDFNMPTNKCSYTLASGSRKGQICGSSIKDDHEKFCKRHQNKPQIETKKEIEEDEKQSEDTSLFIIRKNIFNNFVFKNTPYIFKSATEKFIVAKEGIKGEWIPLTDEDKRICRKQYHLRCKDIDFNKQTSIDMTFIQQNIKLPYETDTVKELPKNKPIVIEEESDESYIPKKKNKPIVIEEESEESYIPKKKRNE
jgi:hypothetical protein